MAFRDPRDISGLVAWYSAESVVGLPDQTDLTQWNDLSGNGNHAVLTTGSYKPRWRQGGYPTGHQHLAFGEHIFGAVVPSAEDAYFELPANLMSGWASGELLTNLHPWGGGLVSAWSLGQDTGPDDQSYLNYYDVSMGEHFGLATGQRVTTTTAGREGLYSIWSAPGDWAVVHRGLNATDTAYVAMSRTDGTVAWPTTPLLGAGRRGGTGQLGPGNVDMRYRGNFQLFILYNRKLTDEERENLQNWAYTHPSGGATARRSSRALWGGIGSFTTTANIEANSDAGVPGQVRPGDRMLAYVFYDIGPGMPASSTGPAGWTLLRSRTVGSQRLEIWTREAQTAEPTSYRWSFGTSTIDGYEYGARIVSYRDVRVVDSSIGGQAETTAETTSAHPAPSLDVPTAVANASVVQFSRCSHSGTFIWNTAVPVAHDGDRYIAERAVVNVAAPTFTPASLSHQLDQAFQHDWMTAAVLLEHVNNRIFADLSGEATSAATMREVPRMRADLSADSTLTAKPSLTARAALTGSGALGGVIFIPRYTAKVSGVGTLRAVGYRRHSPDMALEILDRTLKRAPTAVTVFVGNGRSNRAVDFYIDNFLVWTGETDSDGSMTVSINVPEHPVMGAQGTHTLRIEQGNSNSASDTFTLALNPQPFPIAMGPDAQAVDVPSSTRPNGTRAWILQDLHPVSHGGIGSYVMPYNPIRMSNPYLERQHATFVTTAGRDGQFHVMQGGTVAKEWTFEGYAPTEAMQKALLRYRNLNRRFYIIDHRKRAWKVHLTNIEFVARKRQQLAKAGRASTTTDWGHDYTARAVVLDQTWVEPVDHDGSHYYTDDS